MEAMAADASQVKPMETEDPTLAQREREAKEAAARELARKEAQAKEALAQEAAAQRVAAKEAEARAAEAKRAEQERNRQAEIAANKASKPVVDTKKTSSIPAPETGIVYKVQICAGHREVGRTYFSTRHNYSGAFSVERHQGWIKYVTGRFGSYAEAREQRVAYVAGGHNFPGPFVTAYNNGDRITVQEALLLSKQKWVQ
jgi:phosphopantetheinyl transferase (holo-ACP synthase)